MKSTLLKISVFLLLFTTSLFSQSTGSIRGTIIDSENGEAVFGATIVVRSEKKFAKTDFDGKYSLELAPGAYEVEFQMYGYAPQKRKVNVTAASTQKLDVTFGAQTLETVEVKDRSLNNTEASLLALQRKSGTVSDGISQEAIKKSPDSSAGDVVRRVTGITLIGGKYVFVRGLGERYSNTLLNEVLIPSTEPDKRVVPLDLFPASLIKNIRVIKTFSPEDPGEFSGGLVKIETQEYPDNFQMSLGLGLGRNMNTTGYKFKTFDAADFLGRPNASTERPELVSSLPNEFVFQPGNRFGGLPRGFTNISAATFNQQWTPDEKKGPYDRNFNFTVGNTFKTTESGQRLGILFGVTRSEEFRFREEKTQRYFPVFLSGFRTNEGTFNSPVQGQDSKVYNTETNFGSNLNLSYEFTKGQQISLKTFYTVVSDTNVRESRGFNNIDNFEFLANTNTFTSRQLFNTVLGGDHALQFGSMARPHKLEWNIAYAQANRSEPNLTQQVWRKAQNTSITEPFFRLFNNPDGSRFFSESRDIVRQGNLKYTIPFEQWSGLKSDFKFGGLALERFKDFSFREYGSRSNVGIRQPVDLYPVPGEISFNALDYIDPSTGGLANKTFFERQVEPNSFDAMHKMQAYFGQVDMPLVNKFRFVGGVRVEDSYQKVRTYRSSDASSLRNLDYGCTVDNEDVRVALVRSNVCDFSNNGIGELRKKDTLPSANFIWEFHKDMNVRLGYTQTVTRPDLRELSPFGFTPYFGADRVFGNPNLKRTYIHNYDLRYEYYLTNTDFFGVGGFYKEMSSPIEMVGQPVAGSISANFTYTNAERAQIRGVEIDYRKDFLEKFRFETNVFFIKSQVQVMSWENYTFIRSGLIDSFNRSASYDPTNISRPLQGQSEYVYNLKLEYFITKMRNQAVGLYYNFFGDRIYAVGANGTPDAIEKGVGLTDIVYTYKHDDRLDLKLAAKNIMDTRFRVYQRNGITGEDDLFLAYRMGVNFSFGATYKFF